MSEDVAGAATTTNRRSSQPLNRALAVRLATERLTDAAQSGIPTPPVRDLLGSTDVALAYEVQNMLTLARLTGGAQFVGRKIGLTSPAVQQQLGVGQPDFGVLFDDMAVVNGGRVRRAELIAPKIEAEIAFVLGADLTDFSRHVRPDAPISADERARAAGAVDHALAALEIVDSRVTGWDIAITDTVADNASSAKYVLGEHKVTLDQFAPIDLTMSLTRNGEVASSGTGSACLGDPLNALVWLARTTCAFGSPLRAGEVVLSGALGPMVVVEAGDTFEAELSMLGQVSVTFTQ